MTIRIGHRDYAQDKGFVGGTHRTRAPVETFAAYAPWMPRFGITRLANVTGLDRIGLPVYVAIRPNARSLATAQGKGADAVSAKVSALMESIESWHGEHIDLPLRYESHAKLSQSAAVVDLSTLPVPRGTEIGTSVPMLWVEGFDLMAYEPVYVPFETVTMSCVLPPGQRHVFPPTSNGLASGNHLLEAIVHGLCEVIERDGVALWKMRGGSNLGATQIDLGTLEDPACARVLELLRRADVDVAAWDVTSDLGIPTYAVEIFDGKDDPRSWHLGAFGGYGAHLAPEIAMMRALSEAIQSRLTLIAGSRDDLFRERYKASKEALAAHAQRVRARESTLRFSDRRSMATDTFQDDLRILLERLAHAGISRVIVVDLSKEEIGIPVVKMIVPGLEAARFSLDYEPGQRAQRALVS